MTVKGKVELTERSNGKGLVKFFKGLKAEFKRITWAPKQDVKKAVAAVFSFCILYIIIVGLLDAGFNNIYKIIFGR
jgi:preprotein translocase subunit SecE